MPGDVFPKESVTDNVKWLAIGLIAAFLFLQFLGFAFSTKSPIVAVVSPSMRHESGAFQEWLEENELTDEVKEWPFRNGFLQGDMIVIVGPRREEIKVGDVVIYGEPQNCHVVNPIIHRVIEVTEDGYVIKGDNNPGRIDCDGRPIPFEWIQGKAVLSVPYAGLPRYVLWCATNWELCKRQYEPPRA
jgi:hypothetical protein